MGNNDDNIPKAEVRLETVRKRYEDLGYKVTVYQITDHTVIDALAENDTEVIALEVTNWNINGKLRPKKFLGWVRHWKKVEQDMKDRNDKRELVKRLVYNYSGNIEFMLDYLLKEEVELEQYEEEDPDYIKVLHCGEWYTIPREKKEKKDQSIEGWEEKDG